MAKRYARLNWVNLPSVATPINDTNLNRMDKGIDDIDNAVEDLYTIKLNTANIANNLVTTAAGLVLDARQGKVLKDEVNAINNNLATTQKIYPYLANLSYYTTGMSTTQLYLAMPTFTEITVIVNIDYPLSDAPSTYGMLTIRKGSNNNYGSCEFRTVANTRADLWIGSFQNGVFSGWYDHIPNGKVYSGTATVGNTLTQTITNTTNGKIFVLISLKIGVELEPDKTNVTRIEYADHGDIIIHKTSTTALQGQTIKYYYHLV